MNKTIHANNICYTVYPSHSQRFSNRSTEDHNLKFEVRESRRFSTNIKYSKWHNKNNLLRLFNE